jgi:hypothetical protein
VEADAAAVDDVAVVVAAAGGNSPNARLHLKLELKR